MKQVPMLIRQIGLIVLVTLLGSAGLTFAVNQSILPGIFSGILFWLLFIALLYIVASLIQPIIKGFSKTNVD